MAFFTIVIPVYNASKYIRETLDDILNQKFGDWEMICVDDGSEDKSAEIIRTYLETDDRIRLIKQENAGAGAARNTGLSYATGEYVLFLDADDRFENELLEKLYEQCQKTMADVVIYDVDSFDDITKKIIPLPKHLNMKYIECDENGIIDSKCKEQNVYKISYTAVWNKAIRKGFLNENEIRFQEIYVVDTLYFMLCVMAMAKIVAILPKVLMHYRMGTSGSQISNSDKASIGSFEAGLKAREYLIRHDCYKKYEKQFLNYILDNIKGRFGSFKTLEAEKELYMILHNGGLKLLGINEDTINLLESDSLVDFVHELEDDYNDNLYKNACEWRRKKLISNKRFLISDAMWQLLHNRLAENGYCKVALYGAGAVGKNYFAQFLNQNQIQLVGWYDRQFVQCGYPVLNPELLKQKSDCVVVIAIESESVADKIKTDLLNYGISSDDILWDCPILK